MDNKIVNNEIEQSTKPPSRWIWLGCTLLVIAAGLHSANRIVGGGDTWVAMACGRYTLGEWAAGQPDRTWQMKFLDLFGIHMTKRDPLGAETRPFIPGDKENFGWVNQNWLTHVMFYKMKSAWGEDDQTVSKGEGLIVIYKLLQAVLTALFAYWAARVLGAHPLLASVAAAFGILLSRSFVDLRPNVSTILFAAIMIWALANWKKNRYWALSVMIPVMILWTNVHGGFIYAIFCFIIMAGGHILQTYLGKWSYFLFLGGIIVIIVFFIIGVSHLSDYLDNFEKLNEAGIKSDKDFTEQKIMCYSLQIMWILFIIGAAAVALMSLIRFSSIDNSCFYQAKPRGLHFILGGLLAVIVIPAIFTPFGWENLTHPLIVMFGDEGEKWRRVIEWRPIWDINGFGEARCYVVFLALFFTLFLVKWFLFFTRPAPVQTRKKRAPSSPLNEYWPKIDLGFLGIITLTVYMSITSRRFVFLGGVVLAPFMAQMAQQIIDMIRLRRSYYQSQTVELNPMPRSLAHVGAVLAFTAAAAVSLIFILAMRDIYYGPPADGQERTVFRRMVGITDQPVEAMKFMNANRIKGVVFNEWTNGGFICFSQTPDARTGSPPCKVFMDGRAQAAYTLDHFEYWSTLKNVPRKISPEQYDKVEVLAKYLDMSPTSNDFYQLLYYPSPEKFPNAGIYNNVIEKRDEYLYLAKSNPILLENVLEFEGVNAALISRKRDAYQAQFNIFGRMPKWSLIYIDDRNALFMRLDDPRNSHIILQNIDKLVYPGDLVRNYSLGYIFSHSTNRTIARDGVQKLMALDRYVRDEYFLIYRFGKSLNMEDELFKYYSQKRDYYKKLVDDREPFGRLVNVTSMIAVCEYLAKLSQSQSQLQEAQKYRQEAKHYKELLEEQSSTNKIKAWFW
ncbi:MAG: hypothetical protein JW860_00050 [Sedimentisphaerales bacterium]|nr:hypothetical protein [Sedimentisphaerales bacterium]